METSIADLADQLPPRRSAPQGVTTVIELQSLDSDLMLKGYLAGKRNSCDFAETDPAYQHGYLNGLVDGKHATISQAQEMLAREYVQSGAARGDADRIRSQSHGTE